MTICMMMNMMTPLNKYKMDRKEDRLKKMMNSKSQRKDFNRKRKKPKKNSKKILDINLLNGKRKKILINILKNLWLLIKIKKNQIKDNKDRKKDNNFKKNNNPIIKMKIKKKIIKILIGNKLIIEEDNIKEEEIEG